MKELALETQRSNCFDNVSNKKIIQCRRNKIIIYGYCANPDLSDQKSYKRQVGDMSMLQCSSRATNMQCHSTCDPSLLMPSRIRSPLGLGLKHCVRTPRPTNKIKKTIYPLTRDLCLNQCFKYHPSPEEPAEGPSCIRGVSTSETMIGNHPNAINVSLKNA